MNSSPEKDALEAIEAALELAECYSEEVSTDPLARAMLEMLRANLEIGKSCAHHIQDRADAWWEAQKARMYPRPTAREKAEHNEE